MINKQFTSFFGYTKDNISQGSMNKILPKIYAKHHDKFIQNFILKSADFQSNYFGVEHKNFIQTKSGYLTQVMYNVKILEHDPYKAMLVFICTFKPVF
jgi:hypothetical protein